MARLVVAAAVGIVAGVATANPVVGFQAFSLTYAVTGFLDPTKRLYGSKLNDLKAPQASYGSPIPYIEGAPRLAGVVFWSSEKRAVAHTESQGGKGGPGVESTTYSYEIDMLYGLAINECSAVRRIWSNGRLVWSHADDSDDETIGASGGIPDWRDMRFYSGAVDQLPDPTYEAAVGIGNAPAYRGRCTIFIEGLNLGGSGQLPVLTFEILSESTGAYAVSTLEGPAALAPFQLGTPAYSLTRPFNVMVAGADTISGTLFSFDVYAMDLIAGTSTLTDHVEIGAHNWSTMLGDSDESCFIVGESGGSPVNYQDYYASDGSTVRLDISSNGFAGFVFSKIDDDIVLAVYTGAGGFDRKLRRYSRATGALVATAAVALPTFVQSVAIGGGHVYSLAAAGDNLYQSDLTTLALVDTIAIPSLYNAASGHVACDGETPYVLGAGSPGWEVPVVKWNGTSWEPIAYGGNISGVPHDPTPTSGLFDLYAEPVNNERLGFAEGILFSQKYDVVPGTVKIRWLLGKTAIVLPTLDQVVRRLCLRTGQLTDADIDVTDLADQTVRGFAITQTTTTRQTLENLMLGYLFESVEDDKLRFPERGAAPAATIPYSDLGAGKDTAGEPLALKRLNDNEIPALVSVKYANVLNDFQDGVESGDRLVTESQSVTVVEIPLGFTPTEAKRLADANTMDQAVSVLALGPVALTRKYSRLQATDVVLLTGADGSLFRARITRTTYSDGVYTHDLALDDATAINSAAATDSSYTASTLLRIPVDTELELIDGPLLRDVDDGYGMYAAVGTPGSGRWPGAEAVKSLDGVSYARVFETATRAVMGRASTTLGDFSDGNVFDEVNSLTVDVGGSTLSSVSRDALLTTTANAMLVGAEVIQFRDATFVSPGVYTLTGLLRGRRGSEWAMPGHDANERVILLQTTTLHHLSEDGASRDVPYYWKGVTLGQSRSSAVAKRFTNTDVCLKPFAPVDLRKTLSGAATVIEWHRRSRLSGRLFGSPPLGEASESYDVELYDASDVLVESTTVSAPEWSLSSLQATGAQLIVPVASLRSLAGTRVAVRTDAPGIANAFTTERFLAFDSGGTITETGPILGIVSQWCANGSVVYAVAYTLTNTTPQVYATSTVSKFTVGTLATADASVTAGSPGDWLGIAFDGTNPWVSEQTSGNLRKLDPSTLASVASYAISGAPTALAYAGGKLWVVLPGSFEVARWDIASHTEDFRFSVLAEAHLPVDILVSGANVFVFGSAGIGVYSSSGALVASSPYPPATLMPGRTGVVFGGDVTVAVASPGLSVLTLDTTTGAQLDLTASPTTNLAWAAGAIGTDLYLTGRAGSGFSWDTLAYEAAVPGLAGYHVTVYQNSATVGRGYPATLEL